MEELNALFVETVFNHRWELLVGYHLAGKMVVKNKWDIEKVALACHQRPKTVHYCVELYKAYPNLMSLPDGKNVSWYKICKQLPFYEKNTSKKKIIKLPGKTG